MVHFPPGCSSWSRAEARSPTWVQGPRYLGCPLLSRVELDHKGHILDLACCPQGMPGPAAVATMLVA